MWYHYFEMKDVTPRNILFMFSIREIDGKYSFKVGCNLVCIKRHSHKYLKIITIQSYDKTPYRQTIIQVLI